MSKITLTNLVNLQNETTAVTAINVNNAALTTALDNTLSRDGTSPNTMSAPLDMNSNQIINLPAPGTVNSPARLIDVTSNPTISVPVTGTSGHTLGYLDTNNTHSGTNTFSAVNTFSAANTFAGGSFSGVPTSTTAAADVNTTQIATTAYVLGQAGAASPLIAGAAAAGTSLRYSRQDHVHPTDTTRQAADAQLFSNIPQNSQSAAYGIVATDAQKHIFHPSADTTARTWTIPANASVAFPTGTAITFVNQNGAGVITIAITSDTMRLAGAGTTGNRTLAVNGIATALKISSVEWIISGTGLS